MPQVDLETLASVCGVSGDRKIACETLADEPAGDPDIPECVIADIPPDCPPDSFWLSKDAEFDWFDRNAFLERKESIKGNSNSMNLNPRVNPSRSNSSSSSLQLSAYLKSKATIISLPKGQKTTYVDSKRRNCKLANILLFPKRSDSLGKAPTVVSMAEPSSPKVSCLGRVRSKRCRSRRKTNGPATELKIPVAQQQKTGQVQNVGFMSRIKSLFRSVCHSRRTTNKSSVKINQRSAYSAPKRNVSFNPFSNELEAPADPPALGRATRLASGRRSETWGAGRC